jgi:hypothetical protein
MSCRTRACSPIQRSNWGLRIRCKGHRSNRTGTIVDRNRKPIADPKMGSFVKQPALHVRLYNRFHSESPLERFRIAERTNYYRINALVVALQIVLGPYRCTSWKPPRDVAPNVCCRVAGGAAMPLRRSSPMHCHRDRRWCRRVAASGKPGLRRSDHRPRRQCVPRSSK